ncbi:MAG TPA: hypothetical protein VNL13_00895 [Sulfolobales archaeon]|nr:hypothetical protein [Sulfolobales archaeon]
MVSILTLDGDGSSAPSHPGDDPLNLDGSHVPFGSTAAHDLTGIPRSLWARLKSLDIKRTSNKIKEYPGTNGIPVYALRIFPLRLLAIFSILFALLVSLRVLAPPGVMGLVIDLYSFFLAMVLILMVIRSYGYSVRVFLCPDISSIVVASIYSLLFGGYVPIMIYLFVVLMVLSSSYVEDILGHVIMIPRIQAGQGLVGGSPGARVKLYPGVVIGDDSVISRGSIVVREPFISDLRSFRDVGDLVLGLSSVESGSSEATVISRGSMFSNSYREVSSLSAKVSALFSIAAYLISIPVMILAPGLSTVAISLIVPSAPYVVSLYLFRKASDLARNGIISWNPIKASGKICKASESYIDADVALYSDAQGETLIKPRGSLRQEDLLRIACIAGNIESIRGICKGYEGYPAEYMVIKRESNIAILEDRRTRLKICVASPQEAELYGFMSSISPIDPDTECRGKIYVVSTRHEVLGYICSGRSLSMSNLLTIARISRAKKTILILDTDSIKTLETSGEEVKKILGQVDLMLRRQGQGEPCVEIPRERSLVIVRGPRGEACENTIYVVDPSTAANKYTDTKASLARGASITLRRDLVWLERALNLCSRWRKDLALIALTYIVLRGAGAVLSISTGIMWAQYIFEIVGLIISIFRIYSL